MNKRKMKKVFRLPDVFKRRIRHRIAKIKINDKIGEYGYKNKS